MNEPKKVVFWSKDEDQVLIDNRSSMLIDGLVTLLQSKGFVRTNDAVEKRCRRLNLVYDGPAKIVETEIEDKDVDWKKIVKLSQEFQSKPIDTTTGFAEKHRRIVSLSDIHFPFQRQVVLEQAVEAARGADILVLNGDIFDGYSISSFKKNKHIPILREYAIVLEFIKGLVPLFPKIFLVRGNHEKRFSGSFSKLTGEDEPPYGKDLLSRIAAGEVYDDDGNLTGNYEWDNVFYDETMPWFVLIGKTLFVHPKAFSSIPGGTVSAVYKFFKEKGNYEFDSIIVGHTHQQALYRHKGTLLVEQGCLTAVQEYSFDDGLMFSGNQINGFVELWQDSHGNTDFESVKLHYYGTQFPPEKEV